MIDIHNHLLPEVDDGAKSQSETLEIIKTAEEYEIHKIVATPHYMEESYQIEGETIKKKVRELNELLNKKDINVEILAGHEIYITPDLIKKFKNKDILSINNSKYLLLEMPMNYIPEYLDQVFYDLSVLGYKPVIAHPERNEEVIKNPDILYEWVKDGIIFQLNAGSLFGVYGNNVKKTAFELVDNYLVQVIASDCHGSSKVNLEWLARAKRKLEDICGSYTVQFFTNAEYIINDEEIIYEEPTHFKSKSIWDIFNKINVFSGNEK
ncbi:MAG TPA: CpsB/CapC family capsule biosynthesis tyrosine phosphatase [Halanaerobiales bacterium]|nr:CpsB/CapC family capsule biosynthesis tyrosine phosphatase [Halanaerobiales bacterium]